MSGIEGESRLKAALEGSTFVIVSVRCHGYMVGQERKLGCRKRCLMSMKSVSDLFAGPP